ncbi:hypothetical protein HNP25_004104 [Arcicella rosea]|uniref:Uncharacterized protein n=1 Tax=Arcicella rosea TaxID=502909 RepID=A0A841EYL2_9BACT|nr:hypothetical protein [Arcicella rosea]
MCFTEKVNWKEFEIGKDYRAFLITKSSVAFVVQYTSLQIFFRNQ